MDAQANERVALPRWERVDDADAGEVPVFVEVFEDELSPALAKVEV
jgi:hypothetical protein